MVSTLQLIQNQKLAASLFTFASFALVVSSVLETIIEIGRNKGEAIEFVPSPAQITAASFWILSFGGLITAVTASIRLYELQQRSRRGMTNQSVVPSYWIFLGAWLLFFGLFAIAIGSQQRVEEAREITIV